MVQAPYPFVKPRRHPNCLLLRVHLRGAPSRRHRRILFARMQVECRRLGLVMGQRLGLCVLFGAERMCGSAHRHQIVGWLIDQPEVEQVQLGPLEHLGDVILRASGGTGDPTIWRSATGAVAQWVQYLQGRLQ